MAAAVMAIGLLLAGAVVGAVVPPHHDHLQLVIDTDGGLSLDFHAASCPQLEGIVRAAVQAERGQDVQVTAGLLRIFFHDCLPQGCDASILLDGEKAFGPNASLQPRALQLIESIRAKVHAVCGATVSCADIIALATRDVVYLADGPYWRVELGRLDALASRASDVKGKLPDPDMHVKELMPVFQRNGFTKVDLVALSGAHTVGFAHCSRFTNRLYSYGGTSSRTDPTFNPDYAGQLKGACPVNVGPTIAVNMDPVSPIKFDNIYFINLQYGLGLFTSDQVLYTDETTRPIVDKFAASQKEFFDAFVAAMIKLGRLGVKTGKDGEIRRVCTAFNH